MNRKQWRQQTGAGAEGPLQHRAVPATFEVDDRKICARCGRYIKFRWSFSGGHWRHEYIFDWPVV